MTTFLKALPPFELKTPQAAAVLLLCSVLLGCFGATPLPRRTRTPEGTDVKKIDLSFIHPGETTRAELQEKLRLIDTGYQGDRYFLGRWSSSTWGGWIFVAAYCCGAAGGAGRVWKTGNLLVEFDDQGIVSRVEPFDDRKALRVLAPVAENTPLQLDPPLEMSVNYWKNTTELVPAKIVLSSEKLDFQELSEQRKKHIFSVPSKDLRKLGWPYTLAGTDPTFVSQRIECRYNLKKLGGPRAKDINLQLTLPQMVALMSYVSERNKNAKGE